MDKILILIVGFIVIGASGMFYFQYLLTPIYTVTIETKVIGINNLGHNPIYIKIENGTQYEYWPAYGIYNIIINKTYQITISKDHWNPPKIVNINEVYISDKK